MPDNTELAQILEMVLNHLAQLINPGTTPWSIDVSTKYKEVSATANPEHIMDCPNKCIHLPKKFLKYNISKWNLETYSIIGMVSTMELQYVSEDSDRPFTFSSN